MADMLVRPVTLANDIVRLEPLTLDHAEALFAAAQDERIWRYMSTCPTDTLGSMQAWITDALSAEVSGQQLPFAIVDLATGTITGSTRYLNISPHDRGLEIGWTWLAPAAQRTAINTACKFLLLRHAFEDLGAIRVQLKTDLRNQISQHAIARLGAVREGILRSHMIVRDGYRRDTVMFSITDTEWPLVRARLTARM